MMYHALCGQCGRRASCTTQAELEMLMDAHVRGHVFLPVNGHPDDDECTYRSDGTDDTYCGLPEAAHEDNV